MVASLAAIPPAMPLGRAIGQGALAAGQKGAAEGKRGQGNMQVVCQRRAPRGEWRQHPFLYPRPANRLGAGLCASWTPCPAQAAPGKGTSTRSQGRYPQPTPTPTRTHQKGKGVCMSRLRGLAPQPRVAAVRRGPPKRKSPLGFQDLLIIVYFYDSTANISGKYDTSFFAGSRSGSYKHQP